MGDQWIKVQTSLYCPMPGCIHGDTQTKGGLHEDVKLHTGGDYIGWPYLRPMENSSSKEHRQMRSTREFESKAKTVCSARKQSQRAQSRGTTKSHSYTGNDWSVKTVLHSSLRIEREEIVPLRPLSSVASQNFIQPPDSATLAIGFWDWWFLRLVVLDCSRSKVWSPLMTRFFRDLMESTELERISSVKLGAPRNDNCMRGLRMRMRVFMLTHVCARKLRL